MTEALVSESLAKLLADGPVVIALGVHEFAESLRAQGATVEEVAWRPAGVSDPHLARLLEKLL
jgi:hypothetical protein